MGAPAPPSEHLISVCAQILMLRRRFFGAQQSFFRSLCTAAKLDAVVEQAKYALAHQMCVVIGLQTTGEAANERAATRAAAAAAEADDEEDGAPEARERSASLFDSPCRSCRRQAKQDARKQA